MEKEQAVRKHVNFLKSFSGYEWFLLIAISLSQALISWRLSSLMTTNLWLGLVVDLMFLLAFTANLYYLDEQRGSNDSKLIFLIGLAVAIFIVGIEVVKRAANGTDPLWSGYFATCSFIAMAVVQFGQLGLKFSFSTICTLLVGSALVGQFLGHNEPTKCYQALIHNRWCVEA